MSFTSLPPETVEQIILALDPVDVSALSRTTRYFHQVIYPSSETIASSTVQYIWKNLYLSQPFDNPTACYSVLGRRLIDILAEHEAEFDWRKELREIVRARTIVESFTRRKAVYEAHKALSQAGMSSALTDAEDYSLPPPVDCIRTLRTLVSLITFIPPLHSAEDMLKDDKLSSNLMWVAAECTRAGLLDPLPYATSSSTSEIPAGDTTNSEASDKSSSSFSDMTSNTEQQLRAKLHTFLGLTPYDWTDDAKHESKSYVYKMKNLNWGNEFGPFREEELQEDQSSTNEEPRKPLIRLRVDWVHVHHIQRSVSLKFLESTFTEEHLEKMKLLDVFIYQLSFPYTQLVMEEHEGEGEENDWAGVNGDWDISFCFVDHRDLLLYNKALEEGARPEQLQVNSRVLGQTEMLRTMTASLRITKATDNSEFPDRPTLYFGGEVELGVGNGVISGYVKVMDDSDQEATESERGRNGVVRWHFVSGEANNLIWSGEGIQIGGVRSAYGVLGSWTTVFHDEDDPIGPFWLKKYKITDETVI